MKFEHYSAAPSVAEQPETDEQDADRRPEIGEHQLDEALDKVAAETGVVRALLDKSPALRRLLFLGLAALNLIISPDAKAQNQDSLQARDGQENMDAKLRVAQSLQELIQGLIDKGAFPAGSGSGFRFTAVGPYEVEYFDRDKDSKLDEMERAMLSYKDEQGSRVIVRRNADGVTAIAINDHDAGGFSQMRYGEMLDKYKIVLAGAKFEDSVYVKELTPEEVHKISDSVIEQSAQTGK